MTVLHMDCVEGMKLFPDAYFDSIVTDPPYELGFMGKAWDASGIANNVAMWREALRVLKPGGHLLAFSGSRTYHRMVCAIEDAGFEIRDQIMWVYGSGFPKSLDVSKAIDKAAGAERNGTGEMVRGGCRAARGGEELVGSAMIEAAKWKEITEPATDAARQWAGWGTALKPAHEPICVARKSLVGTVAANVLQFGTGAINIRACRVPGDDDTTTSEEVEAQRYAGRWPANLIHDGSPEVIAAFPADASRFYYVPKASKKDRDEGLDGFAEQHTAAMQGNLISGQPLAGDGKPIAIPIRRNIHPTVKPTDLMRYLCRLVTPPGGMVLDPFAGSGSTGKACALEGFQFIGFELDEQYVAIASARIEEARRA